MNKYISICALAIALLLNSCESWMPCLEGNGDIVTEERYGGLFTGIQVEGDFNVRVEHATTSSVEVTTDDNLQGNIETIVRDGKLIISSKDDACVEYSMATEILVKCPKLTNITQMGSGKLDILNFKEEYFLITQAGSGNITASSLSLSSNIEVNLIGSGNVWVRGKAYDALYILSGSGNIDAETMNVFNCTATLSGSGNIHTFVYEILRITLTGSGSAYYYGDTKNVTKLITGTGSVIKR